GWRPGWPTRPRGPPGGLPQTGVTARQRKRRPNGSHPPPASPCPRSSRKEGAPPRPPPPPAPPRRDQRADHGDGSADAPPCPCPGLPRIPRSGPVFVPVPRQQGVHPAMSSDSVSKVTAARLSRDAYLYIRQPALYQVIN